MVAVRVVISRISRMESSSVDKARSNVDQAKQNKKLGWLKIFSEKLGLSLIDRPSKIIRLRCRGVPNTGNKPRHMIAISYSR